MRTYRALQRFTAASAVLMILGTVALFWDFDVNTQLTEQEHTGGMVKTTSVHDAVAPVSEGPTDAGAEAKVEVSARAADDTERVITSHTPTAQVAEDDSQKKAVPDTRDPKERQWEEWTRQARKSGIELSRLKPALGERWFAGVVQLGVDMPFGAGPWRLDFSNTLYNQVNPVMVSTKGRYIWATNPLTTVYSTGKGLAQRGGWACHRHAACKSPRSRTPLPANCGPHTTKQSHAAHFQSMSVNGSEPVIIESRGPVELFEPEAETDKTLRSAILKASQKHYPSTGRIPDELLFNAPQYNLWIQCMYEPTQEKVLQYAKDAVDNGFPPGVIMIDTNWAEYYGSFKFHPGKFPDPRAMCEELHQMGFKVMVWVTPFISPDSSTFRDARKRGHLLRNINNITAISEWWDGYSALVDFSNPRATAWFHEGLRTLQDLGVDGFKFDGGDPEYYRYHGEAMGEGRLNAYEHCEAFGKVGLEYNLSEYRAGWRLAGTHLAQRLSDKRHFWDNRGLGSIIPNGLAQSMSGYAYNCPDMIGGGQYTDWVEEGTLTPKPGVMDEELFVRYAQAAALFPMMQFSLAPWKVLGPAALELCVEAAKLHVQLAPTIVRLAQEASVTGLPIVRSLGLDEVMDQFMLGDDIMVAPVLRKGALSRRVHIPPGQWIGHDGVGEEWEWESGVSSGDGLYIRGPSVITIGAKPFGKLCSLPWFTRAVRTDS